MHVIGTAGHVDHGKSTLIEALTNVHPDRLEEEQERKMSIVLGFSSLELPSGEMISIVDVPGHRDFIENMLSGIGAIDAALFVVAADEGVMPQTEEHLAILDLLEIPAGVVALTKIDLVEDEEWLDLVELDLQETLENTVLENAPILRVSGKTGKGLDALLNALSETIAARPPRPDLGRPRLSVDRSFTVAGFGTVVTGTLLDGSFRTGEEIVVLPRGREGRIRGLQTHNQDREVVQPGTRTAVNISGIDAGQIQRGDVIAHPEDYRPTRRIDVRFRLLKDVIKPLTHNMEAKLFLGADEVMARVRLLGAEQLLPGQEGWLQLEVPEPVVTLRGEHYILRRPSPSETMGGGVVLDSHPDYRHRRFDERVLSRLEALAGGDPEDVLREVLLSEGVIPWDDLIERASLTDEKARKVLETLLEDERAVLLDDEHALPFVAHKPHWQELLRKTLDRIERYHQRYPLRPGIPREELKSQSGLSEEVFDRVIQALIKTEQLRQEGPILALPDHEIAFSEEQQQRVDHLLRLFTASPYAPPTIKECRAEVGEEVYSALVYQGVIKPLSSEVVFLRETYQEMVQRIKHYLQTRESITVAEARDYFGSSRRYMLAFLEHLDSLGITVRVGDVRHLKRSA